MKVDVLIVGAGPAGLMAANWMAHTGITCLIVEQKLRPTDAGRADGLESRTIEIMDSFGLEHKIWGESNRTIDICLWSKRSDGSLQRDSISANTKPGWSRYQESTLGQSRIENILIEHVRQFPNVEIRQEMKPVSLDIDEDMVGTHDQHSYPIRVKLVSVSTTATTEIGTPHSHETAGTETIQAKYLLGCDGAHSWVRKKLGLKLEGISRDENWGAVDVLPITDFPIASGIADVRRRNMIKTENGNLMIIPRERRLIRVYVQVSPELVTKYWAAGGDPELIMKPIQEVFHPYRFTASHIEWSTVYAVAHRYCNELSRYNRVFLAGDAIHTHSPKAGQGMNVSMQDTYNLGWKLASVVRGVAHPDILQTYHQERFPIAKRLIEFDKRVCRGMIATGTTFDEDHKQALVEENTSMSGLTVTYDSNMLVSQSILDHKPQIDINGYSSKLDLAKTIRLGARIPSELVLSQADSQPYQLQQIFRSTGEWNLIVFGGNIINETQKYQVVTLAAALSSSKSIVQKIKKRQQLRNNCLVGALAIYLVHSAPLTELSIWDLPKIFRPPNEDTGIDYGKAYADNESYHAGGGIAYRNYGLPPQGCIVLLRPDQHVAFMSGLGDVDRLERFLESVNDGLL